MNAVSVAPERDGDRRALRRCGSRRGRSRTGGRLRAPPRPPRGRASGSRAIVSSPGFGWPSRRTNWTVSTFCGTPSSLTSKSAAVRSGTAFVAVADDRHVHADQLDARSEGRRLLLRLLLLAAAAGGGWLLRRLAVGRAGPPDERGRVERRHDRPPPGAARRVRPTSPCAVRPTPLGAHGDGHRVDIVARCEPPAASGTAASQARPPRRGILPSTSRRTETRCRPPSAGSALTPAAANGGYMKVWQFIARHDVPRRFVWLACALVLALAPLTLTGQAPRQAGGRAARSRTTGNRAGPGRQGRSPAQLGRQDPEAGDLRHAAAGTGRCRDRAALPERHAVEPQPRQEVVPQPDRRRPGADVHLLEAVPRAGRRVHRLQGEPRAAR